MTGKYFIDVLGGSGFLSKAANHLGLRGCVHDTKFGSRYHVTQLLVLTRFRHDVSAGTCVAGMISPPRQHTSCCPKAISASASIANLLHRARMPWILEHPCDSWLWNVPKIQTLAAQPRTAWLLADFCVLWTSKQKACVASGWKCGHQGFAPCCTKVCWDRWVLQCVWTKACSSKNFRVTLRAFIFT